MGAGARTPAREARPAAHDVDVTRTPASPATAYAAQVGNATLIGALARRPAFRTPAIPLLSRKQLTSGGTFLGQVQQTPQATLIGTGLDRYNAADAMKGSVPNRLDRLRALDSALYAWLNAAPMESLADNPDSPHVEAIVKESEIEFRRLVNTHKDVVPVDTARMNDNDKALVERLWRSITGGRGRIRVQGSGGFVERQLANIAKILQTPTGIQLLNYLDQPHKKGSSDVNKQVIISDIVPDKLKSKVTTAPTFSFAKETGDEQRTKVKRLTKAPKDPGSYEVMNGIMDPSQIGTTALQKAIFSGKKGFVDTNVQPPVYYGFGKGVSGVFVSSVDAVGKDQNVQGVQPQGTNTEVMAYTPEFVTLAHELGHAMDMLAGATAGGETDILKRTNESQQAATARWSNPEELFNIIGVDNQIRQEHGLAPRGGHAIVLGPSVRLRQARKDELGQLTQIIANQVANWMSHPELTTFVQDCLSARGGTQLEDDTVYDGIKQRWAQIKNQRNLPDPPPPQQNVPQGGGGGVPQPQGGGGGNAPQNGGQVLGAPPNHPPPPIPQQGGNAPQGGDGAQDGGQQQDDEASAEVLTID